jgi:hypothetical protein
MYAPQTARRHNLQRIGTILLLSIGLAGVGAGQTTGWHAPETRSCDDARDALRFASRLTGIGIFERPLRPGRF